MSLLPRIGSLFWLKLIGSTVAISTFFIAYFYVQQQPLFAVYEMPLFAPDHWAPLLPWSAWIYFSLWVYICLPTSMMCRPNELGYYLMGACLLSVVGLSVFYFLPTAVPNWEIDWSAYPTLQFLKESDAAGNACPSLHVAFALYAGLWIGRLFSFLKIRGVWHLLNWLWCLSIVISTMTTKQHVFADVLCGGLLGVVVFWLNNQIARKAKFAAFRKND
ncbi:MULTISPECIES: phosphatase PAP2 family protein [unclassified Lentimonas]|uniref:phosphatase PAP2 family protein n=1 Tax=unclassified Lentimonas TaxID=2630993 RepID=UPI0013251D9D|nr:MULTISPECIES: phosphatase PAP2 family protein [unclassified Lentimonas]CAA6677535.1 Unannotated [Lentimonas sp. CC4]CAA6684368.1 Unannotated [Lentimonas sp. CC6]CAA6692205.1 Unannotated [Lentimonas sp. CC19]CAA6694527.1 Unannotated [Lentimonas sp. CC10]CAA7071864.1 Unannotated [Lentimonas sp. CC11]